MGADTLDLKEISAQRADIDEASGHGLEKINTLYVEKIYIKGHYGKSKLWIKLLWVVLHYGLCHYRLCHYGLCALWDVSL